MKAIEIDINQSDSNYYMGLIYLLGLSEDV